MSDCTHSTSERCSLAISRQNCPACLAADNAALRADCADLRAILAGIMASGRSGDHDSECEIERNASGNACGCELRAENAALRERVAILEAQRGTVIIELRNITSRLYAAKALCAKQATDSGLWFDAQHASEAYLQAALWELHEALEVPHD